MERCARVSALSRPWVASLAGAWFQSVGNCRIGVTTIGSPLLLEWSFLLQSIGCPRHSAIKIPPQLAPGNEPANFGAFSVHSLCFPHAWGRTGTKACLLCLGRCNGTVKTEETEGSRNASGYNCQPKGYVPWRVRLYSRKSAACKLANRLGVCRGGVAKVRGRRDDGLYILPVR